MNSGRIFVLILLVLTGLAAFSPVQASDSEKLANDARRRFGKLNISRFEEMFQTGKFDFRVYKHFTVVDYAAFMGDLDRVKQLAEYADKVKYSISYSYDMLHFAAKSGNLELVQWLVEQGLDIKADDTDDYPTLYYAVNSGNFELVQWLVEQGASIYFDGSESDEMQLDDESDESKSSEKREIRYLNNAVQSGNLKMVQWFLEQGAEFDDIELSFAAQSGALELVQWLHEKGTCILDEINHAAGSGNFELVQWMYDHGADLTREDEFYGNALEEAASSGNLDLVQWLAGKGVSVTDQALCNAAESGNLELVQWLVDQGVDIRTPERRHVYSAMCCAVRSGNLDIVRYFVEEKGIGVDETVAKYVYATALQVAAVHDDFEIVQYLVEHGARVNPGFQIIPYWYSLSRNGGDPEIVEYLKQRDHTLMYLASAISLIVLAIGSYIVYRKLRPRPLAESE